MTRFLVGLGLFALVIIGALYTIPAPAAEAVCPPGTSRADVVEYLATEPAQAPLGVLTGAEAKAFNDSLGVETPEGEVEILISEPEQEALKGVGVYVVMFVNGCATKAGNAPIENFTPFKRTSL